MKTFNIWASVIVAFATVVVLNNCGQSGTGQNTNVQDGLNNSSSSTTATTLATTFTIVYNGNGSTGGSVPLDSTNYQQGQTATTLGNTGNLVNAGYSFAGMNTEADGSGTTYTQGETFAMGPADVTLYAMWTTFPAPAGVSATGGNGQATIRWNNVIGASSYNMYVSTTSEATKATDIKIANVTSPYTHTGLTNGTTYYFVVTSMNSYGESAESSKVNATPQANMAGINYHVPDTGQTTCNDELGAVISCTGAGHDGSYTINASSYTDNSNDTITDNVTGLVWQKQDDGTTRTWDAANTYCSSLSLAGTGWRLPIEFELVTIADFGKYNQAINTTYFPGTQSSCYWSSTTYANNTAFAWGVDFLSGKSYLYNKVLTYYVRCIR